MAVRVIPDQYYAPGGGGPEQYYRDQALLWMTNNPNVPLPPDLRAYAPSPQSGAVNIVGGATSQTEANRDTGGGLLGNIGYYGYGFMGVPEAWGWIPGIEPAPPAPPLPPPDPYPGRTPLPSGYSGTAYALYGPVNGPNQSPEDPWDTFYSLTPFEGASPLTVRPGGGGLSLSDILNTGANIATGGAYGAATGNLGVLEPVVPQKVQDVAQEVSGVGIPDMIQGNAPGTGVLQDLGVSDSDLAGLQLVNQALNPGIRGVIAAKAIANDPKNWAQFIDYAVDVPRYDTDWNNPLKRQGMVDWGFRDVIGPNQPAWAKKDWIGPFGSLVAEYVGGGNPGYQAAFQGMFSKTLNEPYDAGFKRAGIGAGMSWLAGQGSDAVSGMMGSAPPVESSGLAESGADIGMDLEGWSAPESWGTPETVSGETVPVDELYSQPPMDVAPPPNALGTPRTPLVYGSDEFLQAAAELGMDEKQALDLWDKSLGGTSAYEDVAKKFATDAATKYGLKKGIPYAANLLAKSMLGSMATFVPQKPAQITQGWKGSLMTSPEFTQSAAQATKMQPSKTRWEGVTPELPVPDKPLGMEKAEKKKKAEKVLSERLLSPIEEEKLRTYLYDYLA